MYVHILVDAYLLPSFSGAGVLWLRFAARRGAREPAHLALRHLIYPC